MIGVSR